MSKDYIDDDRDVIKVPDDPFQRGLDEKAKRLSEEKPRLDVYAEVEKAVDREYRSRAEAGVTIKTEHVEATGFWQRTKEGLQSWGARIKASWGGK